MCSARVKTQSVLVEVKRTRTRTRTTTGQYDTEASTACAGVCACVARESKNKRGGKAGAVVRRSAFRSMRDIGKLIGA